MIDLRAASAEVAAMLERHGLRDWAQKVEITGWQHRTLMDLEITVTVSIVRVLEGRPECLIGQGPTLKMALGELAWRILARDAQPSRDLRVRT